MEEDIKILEEFIEAVGEEYEVVREKQALEKFIKAYKKLEESKVTRERVNDIQEKIKRIVNKNYIPKSKAKEKIEELEKELTNEITKNDGFAEYREYAIDILEELLGEEE